MKDTAAAAGCQRLAGGRGLRAGVVIRDFMWICGGWVREADSRSGACDCWLRLLINLQRSFVSS